MSHENTQIKRNLIFNILSLTINIGIGILYTPYLVKALGIVAYGVIPLALIVNQYISILTGSLTSALTRFYTIALQKDNKDEASKYISTSFLVVLSIILVLLIPMLIFINYIDYIFTIPVKLIFSAKILFAFTIFSFFASLLSSVLNITLYAYNRLDYLNIISVIRLTFKFLFIVLFFITVKKDISFVGIANLLAEIIILIFSLFLFWKLTKGTIRINLWLFDRSSLTILSVMASWVIVHQLGDTMLYRTDNIIINKFWSTKESGIVGAFTELGTYTMTIAGLITTLFGPLILQAYGKNEHEKVKEMTLDNSVSVGILVAVMVGILCGFSPIILKVWLGEDFVKYNYWLYFKLILIPFYAAAGVFSFAARAWNKVRFPAIGTVLIGLINLVIVWFIANHYNTKDSSISLILFVCTFFGIVQSYFLNGFVFGGFYKNTWKIILLNSLKIGLVLISVCFIGYLLSPVFLKCGNLFFSLILIIITALICLFVSMSFALTSKQKKIVISFIKK